MLRAATVTASAVAALALAACSCPAPQPPRSESTGKDGRASDAEQAEQKRWVDDAIRLGVLSKVVASDKPELWIGPKWRGLDFDDKVKTASAVAAWAFKIPRGGSLRDGEILFLYDNRNGKIIGTFSQAGLSLD